MAGQTIQANFPLGLRNWQPTRERIGFTLVPFKMYGRWKWLFYRYTEVIILPTHYPKLFESA